VGFTAFGLVILIALSCSVYLAYDYIRNSIQSASAFSFLNSETKLNQIAFMGNDGNIWLVSPTGENLRPVTEDKRGYYFPTWAPDSSHLAFVGPDEADETALYISPTYNTQPAIFFQEPKSAPFYLYWAPNSTMLTFLTQETSGLALRLVDLDKPELNRTVAEGAPFYWVWSPQSDKLLVHVGGARAFSEEAHISLIENRQGAERQPLEPAPGHFQAPIWSSDGKYLFYIAADDSGNEAIYKSNAETLEDTVVTDLNGFAFMVLSPQNQHIAYLQFEIGTRAPFGRVYLVDTEGKNRQRLTDFLIASIYWSPDGSKLALLGFTKPNEGPTAKIHGLAAPLAQEPQLRWWIYDVHDQSLEPLTSFAPTAPFLQTVPFFDQYHLSLTFWSPDSRYFIVTKRDDNNDNGSVWVYDTTGQEEARKIGNGALAVWSWQ
jgi:Tol biopolymer transport system component